VLNRIGHINHAQHVSLEKVQSVSQKEAAEEEKKGEETMPTVLVDFSSPNIAKNMHVGHLRSTI